MDIRNAVVAALVRELLFEMSQAIIIDDTFYISKLKPSEISSFVSDGEVSMFQSAKGMGRYEKNKGQFP